MRMTIDQEISFSCMFSIIKETKNLFFTGSCHYTKQGEQVWQELERKGLPNLPTPYLLSFLIASRITSSYLQTTVSSNEPSHAMYVDVFMHWWAAERASHKPEDIRRQKQILHRYNWATRLSFEKSSGAWELGAETSHDLKPNPAHPALLHWIFPFE